MSKISKSPKRHTFQREAYIKRKEASGEQPSEAYLEFFETLAEQRDKSEASDEWKENNLEYDLRSTDWILEKVRTRDAYAQNVYAALCNMRWQKRDVLPILKDEYWSCSWRSAGGIVADMQGKGDYIDWYCSGIGNYQSDNDTDDGSENLAKKQYVPEGVVTEEIEMDFYKLGWVHSKWPEDYK